ncbi:MAG: hypothetical protein A4S15_04395 [Candidatus Raskinella chloraquaticus]|jgi:5-formyltetrahydrofolate cyclo-ligase|uniref:5-formyltetrahydrofolate cyclo-ligase n=2 Tax=Candidatus Raskinella chloraquaticus TaxID=1951219 RepID=A0A1W9I404_9HYPH|nr:MAG: hypothetical protein A4S15_04395 [Proteobacteria bacterium SG_bin8]
MCSAMTEARFAEDQQRLRVAARAARARLSPDERKTAADAAARRALGALSPAPLMVAVSWSIGDEMDTGPLIAGLAEAGRACCLPVVVGKGMALRFRTYAPGDRLAAGAFGVPAPLATEPYVEPDVLIVPLAAFDRAGGRIGYGGGFYDRTLAQLRAKGPVRAFGYAFSVQEVDHIPLRPHDERLDAIITERGVIEV